MIRIRTLVDNYSREALESITKASKSMAELIKNLGYATTHGKNHKTVRKRLEQFGISTEHFINKPFPRKITEQDVFCGNSDVSQSTLRRFYSKLKDIEYKCVICGVSDIWNGKKLVLQLDHKDGNNKNNLPENLRWLCPNCHSQTKTFAGRNVVISDDAIYKQSNKYNRKKNYCVDCGKEIAASSTRCTDCYYKHTNKNSKMPPKETLEALIKSHKGNILAISKIYEVSDNAIKKWCKKYDLWDYVVDCRNSIKNLKKESKPLVIYPVEQIDKNTGQVIAMFSSHKEAERATGIYHIYDASNPNHARKTAGGYIWRRKEI